MSIPFPLCVFLMSTCTLFLTVYVFAVSSQCSGNQQSLLLQLKNDLVFDFSTKLALWNQSIECCSWEGVTCNDGWVTGLDLTEESIAGGLDDSSSLFRLRQLQSLNLAYNTFNNSKIPLKIGELMNLSYLNLSYAGFAGHIPIAISHLTRLVILDLSVDYYNFGDPLLELTNLKVLVHNLSELIELYLNGVAILHQDSEWCQTLSSSLPKLRVLSLNGCGLFGPIDSSLVNLQSLSIIHLNNNNFSASVPEFFKDFKNLTTLDLSSSALNGQFPEKIFLVRTLKMIDMSENELLQGSLLEFLPNSSFQTMLLRGCNFSGSSPNSIANLKQLVYLDLSQNSFNGSIPSFSRAKNLIDINLSSNSLSGEITATKWEKLKNLHYLDFSDNLLTGNIPSSLFPSQSLYKLLLSYNQFSGQLNKFSNISSYPLEELDLSSNQLDGPIPMCIFEFQDLWILSLSRNNFNGSFQFNVFQKLSNLLTLHLSNNNLSIEYDRLNLSLPFFPQIQTIGLAYCKLKVFPNFLRNQSRLNSVDLSGNQIYGDIPSWFWENPSLNHINLSHNNLVNLNGPILNLSYLGFLDLHSNQFQGQLLMLPSITYVDLSTNNFHSTIAASIGNSLGSLSILSFSNNKLYGSIPKSICNATKLHFLDLSSNFLSGKIPRCLLEMSKTLRALNLGRNNLNGTIPDAFQDECGLESLVLNENHLEGVLPKYLANCLRLHLLDVRNNHIKGTFPFYLKNIIALKVLVLRSNKFYGSITHPKPISLWPMLQILDISSNIFDGKLPIMFLSTLKAIMEDKDKGHLMPNDIQFVGDFFFMKIR